MTQRDGDLAAEASEKLQAQYIDYVLANGEDYVDLEDPMRAETRRSLFAKIDFKWRSHDKKILEQIRAGVDTMFKSMYSDMKRVADNLYAEMRVPEVNPDTGVVLVDAQGRVVWQKTPSGDYVENWGLLTGQDIETALFNIARLKLDLAPRVNALLNEAVFAKHIAEDAHHDAYKDQLEGTVKDRDAFASEKARQDKYHAFYRYYLWSQADAFLKELNGLVRLLERVRYWRIDDSGKTSP